MSLLLTREVPLMNWTLLCQLIVLYFVFSVLGWMMEVTLKYIQYHRFINRGFLIGPYCPIYGSGVVLVTVLVGGLVGIRGGTPGEIFLAGFFICGGLEYFISWYMEKAFHARWWDYSQKPMNLNGRVWIGNLMLFGLASVVIVVWIDPVYFRLVEKLPLFWLHFAAIAIVTLLVSDCVVSHMMERLKQARRDFKDAQRRTKELLNEQARRRKNGEAMEELAARLEAASAAMKERRAKLRELERKLRREED